MCCGCCMTLIKRFRRTDSSSNLNHTYESNRIPSQMSNIEMANKRKKESSVKLAKRFKIHFHKRKPILQTKDLNVYSVHDSNNNNIHSNYSNMPSANTTLEYSEQHRHEYVNDAFQVDIIIDRLNKNSNEDSEFYKTEYPLEYVHRLDQDALNAIVKHMYTKETDMSVNNAVENNNNENSNDTKFQIVFNEKISL